MRLFVGIELSGPAQETILAARALLVETVSHQGVRFVRPEKLHLTLAFLGEVQEDKLNALKAALAGFENCGELSLTTTNLGAFPDVHRPKVIWIGLDGDIAALSDLADRVVAEMKPFAPELDEKPYSPHITLARVNPGSKEVGRRLKTIELDSTGAALPVQSIALFHSRRDGSYENLAEVSLGSSSSLAGESAEA